MKHEQSQQAINRQSGQSRPLPAELDAEAGLIASALVGSRTADSTEGRTCSGLARSPARETLEFALHVHQYHREYIAAADQKAGFLSAFASALLVYMYQLSLQLRWLKPLAQWSAVDLFAFVGMAALFVSLVASASVVAPRLATSHRGFVFFLSVAEHESASEYAASVVGETGESLTRAMLRHTYDLAKIARRKYRTLAVAIWASAVGVGLSLVAILLGRMA